LQGAELFRSHDREPMPFAVGQILAERYEIVRELGRGGMATVFLATDRQTGGTVAVKVMRPEVNLSRADGRFEREMRITAKLRHPGIVPLLDTGEVDGIPFFTMSYIEGETLAQRLARETQLSFDDALSIMRELTDALAYAHAAGVLHRDIKPANILLSGGRAVLGDFGIARAIESGTEHSITSSGIAVGTTEYMSPEQGSGGPIDHRSDIYSLGVVFYEMLAGAPPFTGPTAQAVLARHAQDAMPSLRTVRKTVTRRLEAVLEKALEKVPADRYASMLEFQTALRDPALLDRTTDLVPRATRRRRRWIGAGIVALGVAAATGVALSRSGIARPLDAHRVVGFPLQAPPSIGGSAAAGEDMATLIGSALDRRGQLRWIDGWRELDDADRSNSDGASADRMRSIARAQGAAWYVTGRIIVNGDSASVLLELVNVASDSVASRPKSSGPANDLWRVALRAVNQILPSLVAGGSARDLEAGWMDRDPAAVASFLAGEGAFRRARPDAAFELFREAVRTDSGFYLAMVRGAQAATASHRPSEARELVQRALGKSMPTQYRHFTVGYLAYVDGLADSAVAEFRRAIALDRELSAAWAQLGETYIHLVPNAARSDSLADAAFAEARSLDPSSIHQLYHAIEIAWRRSDARAAAPLVERFLASNPDSTQAAEIRMLDACGREGPSAVNWAREVRRDVFAVLSAARALSVRGAQLACANAGYDAVLQMDSASAAQDGALAARQAALLGRVGLLVAQGKAGEIPSLIDASVARGDGGTSLYLLLASLAPSLAGQAAAVASKDSARFGDDLSRCTKAERCWLLAQYHALLGHARQASTVATLLAARVPTDSSGTVALYAYATAASARLASGDSTGAREALVALLRSPFPPGAELTWNPIGGFGRERLLLAELLMAQGRPAEALAVADALDSAAPAVFVMYLRPSLELRVRAAEALRYSVAAARYRARLARLNP
jgi:serine/threonine-protein kinase